MTIRKISVIASIAVSLLLLEVGVKLLFPSYDPSGHVRFIRTGNIMLGKPHTTQRHIKNSGDYDVSISFNARGFRDEKDIAVAIPEDIVVVGDSFAFGWGVRVEERFSNQLEAMGKQRVFNIAIPGDIRLYDQLLRHAEVQGAQIGKLIFTICMENDIRNYDIAIPQRGLKTSVSYSTLHKIKKWMIANSAANFFYQPCRTSTFMAQENVC